MFTNDYWQVAQFANDLEQFNGYLDLEGQKALGEAKMRYRRAKEHLAYDLEKHCGSADAAIAQVNSDLDKLAEAEPEWENVIATVRQDLIDRLDGQRNTRPLFKKLVRYATPIALACAVAAYLATWWYNDLDIDAALETRDGLIQHAEAYDKAINYESGSGLRGGFLRDLVMAPFRPDELEIMAARRFVELVLSGYDKLASEQAACGLLLSNEGEPLSDPEKELIAKVSAKLRDPDTRWSNPPTQSVLAAIAEAKPCLDLQELEASLKSLGVKPQRNQPSEGAGN